MFAAQGTAGPETPQPRPAEATAAPAFPEATPSPRRDVTAAAFPRLSSAQTDYFNPSMSLRGHPFMFTVGEGGRCKHSSLVPQPGGSSPTASGSPGALGKAAGHGAQLCLPRAGAAGGERAPEGLSEALLLQ